jgi:hypothetical protein
MDAAIVATLKANFIISAPGEFGLCKIGHFDGLSAVSFMK